MRVERRRRRVVDAVHHVRHAVRAVRILTACQTVSHIRLVICREDAWQQKAPSARPRRNGSEVMKRTARKHVLLLARTDTLLPTGEGAARGCDGVVWDLGQRLERLARGTVR